MKLTLRTVTGATKNFDVEPTDTILSVKQKIADEYDIATLRLCHKGRVLEDAKSLQNEKIAEGESIVIAGRKVTAAAAAAAKTAPTPTTTEVKSAPAPATTNNKEETTAPTTTTSTTSQDSAPAQTTTPAETTTTASTTTANNNTTQDAAPSTTTTTTAPTPAPATNNEEGVPAALIENLIAMGFPDRTEVVLALRAAYMNPDRAVEYLCSGIPDSVRREMAQAAMPPPPQPQAPAGQNPVTGGGNANANNSDNAAALGAMLAERQRQQGAGQQQQQQQGLRGALATIPQFEQIRTHVQRNPSSLPTLMQQLQQNYPAVFTQVQANPQEFLDIVNGPTPVGPQGGAGGQAGGQGDEPEGPPQPPDPAAVERLVALGGGMWDVQAATLVLMACRNNEELAANVLFDNGGVPPQLVSAMMAAANGELPDDEEGDEEGQ